jgi:hypothetical protein
LLTRPVESTAEYVLAVLDPDPDSGIVHQRRVEGHIQRKWLSTIASPALLVDLLKRLFQFSTLQTLNRLGRNALHEACAANKADSHEATIKVLVDKHVSNMIAQDDRGCDNVAHDRGFCHPRLLLRSTSSVAAMEPWKKPRGLRGAEPWTLSDKGAIYIMEYNQ